MFKLKYQGEFISKYDMISYRIEIAEKDYIGEVTEMVMQADNPLVFIWEKRGDDFTQTVKASEATINVLSITNFQYLGLFSSNPQKYRLTVYRNSQLYWRGFVVADLYSETFAAPPYEVAIKAVDGFGLLSKINYPTLSGLTSLHDIMSTCLSKLDLDLKVCDWLDLYSEGMNESESPLKQCFINMDILHKVNTEVTYMDMLDMCLKPFAAQLFQVNGSIHIRRVASLYKKYRPADFFVVSSNLPSGRLSSSTGQNIVTSTGLFITTAHSVRNISEDIWEDKSYQLDTSTLDIKPALKNVIITVDGKLNKNIGHKFYDPTQWTLPSDDQSMLMLYDKESLKLSGTNGALGKTATIKLGDICKSSETYNASFKLRPDYFSNGSMPTTRKFNIKYTITVYSNSAIYYYNDELALWQKEAYYIELSLDWKIRDKTESDIKYSIPGFPQNGSLLFTIYQTLERRESSSPRDPSKMVESCYYNNFEIELEDGEDSEKALTSTYLISALNNVDLEVDIPISDIVHVPNNNILYQQYYLHKGKPTNYWHAKGDNNYLSLNDCIYNSACTFHQNPSRTISGDMLTSKHIDLNSIFIDDKYLHTSFFTNSLEYNTVEDTYAVELVELPGYNNETAAVPGTCSKILSLTNIVKAVKVGRYLICLLSTGRTYHFDTLRNEGQEYTNNYIDIFAGENSFVGLTATEIIVKDYQNGTIDSVDIEDIEHFFNHLPYATYMKGYVYTVIEGGRGDRKYTALYCPKLHDSTSTRVSSAVIRGMPKNIYADGDSLVVNTTDAGYYHDRHTQIGMLMNSVDNVDILDISNHHIIESSGKLISIYNRVNFTEKLLLKKIQTTAKFAAHTLHSFAYATDSTCMVFNDKTNRIDTVKGLSIDYTTLAIMYINSSLYIVRDNGIYRYR